MAKYSWLSVSLILLGAIPVSAGELDPPSLPETTETLEQLQTQTGRGFAFDPILEVNPNRGSFNTEIPVELPPNLVGFSSLKLIYQSQNSENAGVGVGWKWNLPVIQRNPKALPRIPYQALGLLGNSELTPTGENLSALGAELGRLLRIAQLRVAVGRYESFRPMAEDKYVLFVRVLGADSNPIAWVALLPSGMRWIFSADGLPIAVADIKGNALRFDWAEGLLMGITDELGKWAARIGYTQGRQSFPSWTAQGFQVLPLGLQSIYFANSRTGEERTLIFRTSEGGFLLAAGWRGGALPLFQGEYRAVRELVPRVYQDEQNTFGYLDNQIPYRRYPDEPFLGLRQDPNADELSFLVDLNGDGRTDRIRFDLRENKAHYATIWNDCRERHSDHFREHRPLLDRPISSSVEMMVQGNSSVSEANWKEDRSLALPGLERPFLYQVDVEERTFIESRVECNKIDTQPRAIFFVDLNGDGRKDMIDCGYDAETGSVPVESAAEQEIIAPDGKIHKVKRHHNNLAWAVLNMTRPDLTGGRAFSNPFDFEGKIPRLYFQAPKEEVLDSILAQDGMDAHPGSSFITNASEWRPVPQVGFKCHRGSLFFDANKDGHLDVLTGKKLYLGTDVPGQYKSITVDPGQFFEPAREDAPTDINDTNLLVADMEQTGKFSVVAARALELNLNSGRFELVKNGTTRGFAPYPAAGRLLTGMISPFGGKIEVSYAFKSGAWVVGSVARRPDYPGARIAQPGVVTEYSYLSPLREFYSGMFVGFSSTRETTHVEDSRYAGQFADRVVERYYYKDISPAAAYLSSRARLNGRPMLLRTGSRKSGLRETTYELKAVDLGNRRMLPFNAVTAEHVYEANSTRILDSRTTNVRYPSDEGLWIHDDKGNRVLPLRKIVEEQGHGIPSQHSDQLLNTRRLEERRWKFFVSQYLMKPEFARVRDKDDRQYRADRAWTYDEKADLRRYCQVASSMESRCSEYAWDEQGRLVQTTSSIGKLQTATYSPGFPLPDEVMSRAGGTSSEGPLVEKRAYESLTGRLIGLTTPSGARWTRTYTPDGLLLNVVEATRNSIYFALEGTTLPSCWLDSEAVCRAPNEIWYRSEGVLSAWELDGMGRIEGTRSAVRTAGERHSGLSVFGMRQELLARTEPAMGRLASQKIDYRAGYDDQGRLVGERSYLSSPDAKDMSMRTKQYSGPCEFETLDGYLQKTTCTNLFGNTEKQVVGNEKLVFDTTADGDLLQIPSLGIEWTPNRFGEVQETKAESGKPVPQWSLMQQVIAHHAGGKDVTDAFDYSRRLDSFGRLVDAQQSLLIEGTPLRPTDVRDRRQYTRGLLSDWQLTLPAKGNKPVFAQHLESDERGKLKSWASLGYKAVYDRDTFGRVTRFRMLKPGGETYLDLQYGYEAGLLQSITSVQNVSGQKRAVISGIQRDALNRITGLQYGNGLRAARSFHGTSPRLESIEIRDAALTAFWRERLIENSQTHQIIGRETESTLRGGTPVVDRFDYDSASYQLASPGPMALAAATRDDFSRATRVGNLNVEWNGAFLAQTARSGDTSSARSYYYDADETLAASCPKGVIPGESPEKCVIRLSEDVYLVEGQLSIALRVEGMIVAIIQGTEIQPVIVDHLGSVRAGFSEDGRRLLWERHYGAWGEKQVLTAPAVIPESVAANAGRERAVVWSFAYLKEIPGAGVSPELPLYWSKTRVYCPALREWMSVDPLVLWNPSQLINRPGNWNALRYAANRPLEYVDLTGKDVVKIGGGFTTTQGIGSVEIHGGIAIGYGREKGLSIGFYGGAQAGVAAGEETGAGLQLTLSHEDQVKIGTVLTTTRGGGAKVLLGGGLDHTESVDKDGKKTGEFTLTLDFGGGGGVHDRGGFEHTIGAYNCDNGDDGVGEGASDGGGPDGDGDDGGGDDGGSGDERADRSDHRPGDTK